MLHQFVNMSLTMQVTLERQFMYQHGVIGWCDGAGKTSSTRASFLYLADSRARAYCACSGCGWGLFGHFYSHPSFLSSFSLSFGRRPDID